MTRYDSEAEIEAVLSRLQGSPKDKGTLRAIIQRLEDLTIVDPLTGVRNRRYFDQQLDEEVAYAQRHGTPLGVILGDIDSFKMLNTNFGHPYGDRVLREAAQTLQLVLQRPYDHEARYGGEEFAYIGRAELPELLWIAEKQREAIQGLVIPYAEGESVIPVQITMSFGIGVFKQEWTAQQLLEQTDRALYAAKENNRNCIICADPEHPFGPRSVTA
jgi:diguanylate cyclase (GGDEF)-like protein